MKHRVIRTATQPIPDVVRSNFVHPPIFLHNHDRTHTLHCRLVLQSTLREHSEQLDLQRMWPGCISRRADTNRPSALLTILVLVWRPWAVRSINWVFPKSRALNRLALRTKLSVVSIVSGVTATVDQLDPLPDYNLFAHSNCYNECHGGTVLAGNTNSDQQLVRCTLHLEREM
jgi:hypothetical protein